MTSGKRRHRPRTFETWIVVRSGLDRVNNLISLYDQAAKFPQSERRTPASDILRAAVVLLHAVTEEYVRYVCRNALPHAGEKELNDIPLIGHRRGSKFELGALTRHRGRTVDAVIAESVIEHLAKTSFSSLGDIMRVLAAAGIPVTKLRVRRAELHRLIDRRHKIVHEADDVPARKLRSQIPRALSRAQVVRWVAAVDTLIAEVDKYWRTGRWSS